MTNAEWVIALWLLLPPAIIIFFSATCLLHLRSVSDRSSTCEPSVKCSRCEVFVPVKGVFADQHRIMSSFVEQNHPDYHVTYILDDETDPANAVVDDICRRSPHASKLIAGDGHMCAQKNHCLIQGIKRLDAETDIIVFCDSTNEQPHDWLLRLTKLIDMGSADVVTTCRIFYPIPPTLAGVCQSVYGCLLMALNRTRTWPWGGGTAIRRSTFFDLNVPNAWANTLSDDMVLGSILHKSGIFVHYELAARLKTTLYQQTMSGFLGFLDRQIVSPKFTNPGLWVLTVCLTMNFSAAILFAFSVILVLFPMGIASVPVLVSAVAFCCSIAILSLVLRLSYQFQVPFAKWLVAGFLNLLLAGFVSGRSLLRNHVDWHGRRYRGGRNGAVLSVCDLERATDCTDASASSSRERNHVAAHEEIDSPWTKEVENDDGRVMQRPQVG